VNGSEKYRPLKVEGVGIKYDKIDGIPFEAVEALG
jgi:hypothetical protein